MNMTDTPTEDELTLVAAKFFNMATLLFLLGKTPEEIKEMCEHYFDLVVKHAHAAKVHVFVDEAGRQLKEVYVSFSDEQMNAVKESLESFRQRHLNILAQGDAFLTTSFAQFNEAYQSSSVLIQWVDRPDFSGI